MNCLKCGAPHVEEGKYCYECGAEVVNKVETSVEPVVSEINKVESGAAPVVNETNIVEPAAPALEQSVTNDAANKDLTINANIIEKLNKKNKTLLTIAIIESLLLLLIAAFYVFKDYII